MPTQQGREDRLASIERRVAQLEREHALLRDRVETVRAAARTLAHRNQQLLADRQEQSA